MNYILKPNEELVAEINENFKKYLSDPEKVETAANQIVDYLIMDAIMSVAFEVDIERKTNLREIIKGDAEEEKYQIIEGHDVDIFGQTSTGKKNYECVCPSCNRTLAASRFAPHLEKCMGMGRNSSRIASRRIASNVNKDSYTAGLSDDDDEDDADWTSSNDKKGKKKKDKLLLKKSKSSKSGRSDGASTSSSFSDAAAALPLTDELPLADLAQIFSDE